MYPMKSYATSQKGVHGEDTNYVFNLHYKTKGAGETGNKMTIYFSDWQKAKALSEHNYLSCS
jgi:hypothetical protein